MATTKEYTNEELNYYRICYLTTDITTGGVIISVNNLQTGME